MQENLKVSTLIQGMRPEVKRHLLLNLDENTKYMNLRQYLVNYESTERWTNSLAQQQGTPYRTTTDLIKEKITEVLQQWTSTKPGVKVSGSAKEVSKEKALEKDTKAKVKAKARTSEKDLETKAKEKVTKAKVEVETGKAEVEVSEATKVEVEDTKAKVKALVVLVATKVEEKEKHKQLPECVITVTGTDTLKHSVDRSNVTWVTKLGTLTLKTQASKPVALELLLKPQLLFPGTNLQASQERSPQTSQ